MHQALKSRTIDINQDATIRNGQKKSLPHIKVKTTVMKKGNSKNKENKNQNAFKIKTKAQAGSNSFKRTSKFALMSIINTTRGVFLKDRSTDEKLKFYKYFEDKENILQLFKSKHKANFEHRYLEFRSFERELNADFSSLEDKGVYFKMLTTGARIVEQVLKDNELYPTRSNTKPSIFWSGSMISHDFYSSLDCYQKINHFPKSNEISRKDFMFINIVKMKQKFPRDFDFIPNSFVLPKDHGFLVKEMDLHHGKKTYICKPVASSQGKGIFLTNDIAEVG